MDEIDGVLCLRPGPGGQGAEEIDGLLSEWYPHWKKYVDNPYDPAGEKEYMEWKLGWPHTIQEELDEKRAKKDKE